MKKGTSVGRLAIQMLSLMLATSGGCEGRPLLTLPQSIIVVDQYARGGAGLSLSGPDIQRLWQAFAAQQQAQIQYIDLYGQPL